MPSEPEKIFEVEGELCMNISAMLSWFAELDLDEVGNPVARGTIERFQRRAQRVLAVESATSGRTVGQILSDAWGPGPLEAGERKPGSRYTVKTDDLLAWLDRPIRSVGA